MTSGGARSQSGPPKDPNSLRSDRAGFRLTSLPASYDGVAPPWPLMRPTKRELEVWAELWTKAQANAWAQASEQWRIPTIAMYARVFVRCEARNAAPSLLTQLHRLADQIGLSSGSLARLGWKIVADEVAAKAAEKADMVPVETPAERRPKRLRPVADGSAG